MQHKRTHESWAYELRLGSRQKEMSMPTPKEGESHEDWMARCVPALIEEGKDRDQAVAICISMHGPDEG